MRKILILCLFAFCFAPAAVQKRLAVFPCTGTWNPNELNTLRDRIQELIIEVLPTDDFYVIPYKDVEERVGLSDLDEACDETSGVCFSKVMRKVNANYGTGCIVNTQGNKWVLTFQVYSNDEKYLIVDKTYDKDPKNLNDLISIVKGQFPVAIKEKFFGDLVVKPAYKDDIGKKENWNLRVNNVVQKSYENSFFPGNYDIKLTHNCYDDINSSVEINRGRTEMFDVAKHMNLKTAELVLNAKRNDKPVNGEEVLVDGVKKGETPFTGTVALCSEINIGRKKEKVNVKLLPNQRVEYTHEMSLVQKTSTFVAIGLNVLGAAAIGYGVYENMKASNAYDDYGKRGQSAEYYDDAWEKAKSSTTKRNVFYIVGGVVLASGVGVHIWF